MKQSHRRNKSQRSHHARHFERLEERALFAAHIVGSPTVYSTIQAAVNAAAPGAVIDVDAGTYTETVTVNKQLTLRGAEWGVDARSSLRGATGKESIVTGPNSGSGNAAGFYIDADDVTLDGFTVQGENNGDNYAAGAGIVMAPNIAGTHILNNIVQNNVSGLFLANSSATDPAVIQHNLFSANNNAGGNGGRGIYTDGTIFGNILTNVIIDSNTFYDNHGTTGTTFAEAGIALEATTPGHQSNITITNNIFNSNGKAVLFFNTTNILIEGNTVTQQGDSAGTLRFEGGDSNVTIEYNTVYENGGTGVAIDSKAVPYNNSAFTIEFNNFYDNSTDWGDNLSVIANDLNYTGPLIATNNWWGNASGPSGDGTGTGDKIYGNGSYNQGAQWTESTGGDAIFSPWATAAFATPAVPAAPTNVTISTAAATPPALNPTITLTWQAAAGSPDEYEIDRSTDGVTFSTYAIVGASTTSYTDTAISANATYFYRISANNGAGSSPYTAVATITTQYAPMVNISSLQWVSATVGYDTIQKNLSIDGNSLSLRGNTYATGIGTHAASQIVYNLAGAYMSFVSDVGVDDEVDGQGSVDFQVVGDGKVLFDSGIVTGSSPVVHIDVSVAGVQQLTLIATNGIANDIDYDHADWAGAELLTTAAPTIPSAPTNLTATAASATEVDLAWVNTAANQAGVQISRSTDGTNFTPLATLGAGASSYSDTGLSFDTQYYYSVVATNSAGASPASNIANATTLLAPNVYLSDLTPVSETVGWGTVQDDLSIKGNPLTLRGITYVEGIGTHAPSTLVYNLNGAYSTFTSDVGIDDETAGQGSVDFQVIGDGVVLYDSGILTGSSPTAHINISVAGVQQLSLVATNGVPNDIDYDHADWAGAELLNSAAAPTLPSAPADLTATAVGAGQINLAWVNTSANQTGVEIERSPDGTTNFSLVATLGAGQAEYSDTGLSIDTQYYYRVVASNGVGDSSSAVITATTLRLPSIYLSDMTPVSATAGWGTVQFDQSILGNTLSLRGTKYATGIGTHASSTIVYNLGGNYSAFVADVGVDDETNGQGAVDFQVFGDGKLLYDTGVLTGTSPVVHLNIDVSGVQQLTLQANPGIAGTIDYDHADWAGAQLIG